MIEYPGDDVWLNSAELRSWHVAVLAMVTGKSHLRMGSSGDDSSGCNGRRHENVCGHAIADCISGCIVEHWGHSWRCWACDRWQVPFSYWESNSCEYCGERCPPGAEMMWRRANWVDSEDQDSEPEDGCYLKRDIRYKED